MTRKKLKKKVLLFLVEGANDEAALGKALDNLHKNHSQDDLIRIGMTHGDITSDFRVKNVTHEVVTHVKKYLADYKLKRSDIYEIVLLLDMDGAFVPDEVILQSDKYSRAFYCEDKILHKNPEVLQKTHKHKQSHINKLLTLNKVLVDVPFSVYFVSCNLDHLICGNANLTDREKSSAADDFSMKYGEDADGFLKFFHDPKINLDSSYKKSWDAIKQELNSLKKYSNMNVFLDRCYPSTEVANEFYI